MKEEWVAESTATSSGGKPEKRFPATDLPEDVQIAILKRETDRSTALVPYNKEVPTQPKKSFNQVSNFSGLTSDQKKRALFRADLVRLYLQALKKATRGGKQRAREQFELALKSFDGTILAVVHDRYFIERFATCLWIVKEKKIQQVYL